MKRYQIIYEDSDIVVVDKPAGLLTVPIPKSHTVNLFELLKQHQRSPIFVVHRIDRYTSGVVMFARHRKAFLDLKAQFIDRSAQRMYRAIVHGNLEAEEGTLVHSMKMVRTGFRNIITEHNDSESAEATLHYRVVETLAAATVVDVMLETGLKNQIRVQFAEIGHPVIGDRQYGDVEDLMGMDRQALHALRLGITHPRKGERLWFDSPLPKDMGRLLAGLRNPVDEK